MGALERHATQGGGDDDLALVAMAQQDRNAFAALYERYHRPVYLYCYRRLLNAEVAEDAAANVFVKAIVALPKFRPDPRRSGSTFRSWLFAIAHNVVVDIWRKQRSDVSLDVESESGAFREIEDPADLPEDITLASEESQMIARLLNRLPERQRATVELRLAGLTTAEIATAMDMPFGAAKAMQFRAYRRLRELLVADPHAITREVPK